MCYLHLVPIRLCAKSEEPNTGRSTQQSAAWRKPVSYLVLLLAMLAFSSIASRAQQSTGEITGIVTDRSGAVIPNASVTYQNVSTTERRTVQTNSSGLYDFPNLNPGTYTITITAPGFRKTTVAAFNILAGDRHRADATLEIGEATQTVEVESATEALQTDSSSISRSVTPENVQSMPLNGRNYTQLVQLTPGATEGSPTSLNSGGAPDDRRQGSNVSINSQGAALNNNMIDGLDNNERIIGTVGVRPSIDDIQEVKVLTNSYTAESGRAAGAVINIITKSGTNSYHGSLYEYFRNDLLNSYAYQFGAHNSKPELRQNQFGGSFGGPIKKDRTFFFGDIEAFRLVQQMNPSSATVPSLFEMQNPGNFSDITSATAAKCNPNGPINTPSQYVNGCAYNPATGLQYANNTIPTPSIDPVALDYFQLYPILDGKTPGHLASNFPGGTASATGQIPYVNSFNRLQNFEVWDLRVDHQFSSANSLFARYSENDYWTYTPQGALPSEKVAGVLVNGQTGVNGTSPQKARNAQVGYTHVFSPAVLLQLGAGWTYVDNFSTPPNYGLNPNNAFGEPGINFQQLDSALGGVGPGGGLTGFGAGRPGFVPLEDKDNTYQIAGSLFWTKGKHAFKFGSALIRRQAYNFQETNGMGNITFTNGAPGLLTGFYSGATRNNNFYQGKPISEYYRTWEPNWFVADDWRISSKLTLNLGVRWDLFTPYTEKYDHIANFYPANGGTVVVAGQNGATRTANIPLFKKNFQPRVGFAYTPAPGLVVRGGFGLSAFPTTYTASARLVNQPFVYSFTCTNGVNCPGGFQFLKQGLPTPGTIDPANPNELSFNCMTQTAYNAALAAGITPSVTPNSKICYPQSLNSTEPNYRDAYLEQFNLTVQKELYKNVITVSYVGALGRHLGDNLADVNLAPVGIITSTAGTGNTIENDTRPYWKANPNLTGVPAVLTGGISSYHGLQATLERRLSNGLSYLASTTWSHALDNVNEVGAGGNLTAISFDPTSPFYHPKYDYGNGNLDQRTRFVFQGTYAPTFLANRHDVLGWVAGGWQGSALTVWTTGLPYSVANSTLRSLVSPYLRADRPNQVANPFANVPAPKQGLVSYFDPAAFAPQPFGTGGNARRNSMYAPAGQHVDLSVAKYFPIRENLKLNFRAEGYNMLNSVTFNSPNTTVGTSTFGYINSTRADYNPRLYQFAMRLEF